VVVQELIKIIGSVKNTDSWDESRKLLESKGKNLTKYKELYLRMQESLRSRL
jgi:hypothetical protein